MKNSLYAWLFGMFIISSTAFACGNMVTQEPINFHYDEITLTDGTKYHVISNDKVPYGQSFSEEEKKKFKASVTQLDYWYNKTKNIDYLSDKGLILMYLGRYKEAEAIFLKIEKLHPNRYSTAANLGTTYELLGNNKSALQWIKKSVQINPESHKNSEWIHVNILDAKIKGSKFHTANYILKTDFGDAELPISNLSKKALQDLHDQLLFQLNERVHFIKPKNKIVAELIYALADTAFLLKKYSGASYNYQLAIDYGYSGKHIEARLEEATKRAETHYKQKQDRTKLLQIIGLVCLALFFLGLCLWLLSLFYKKITQKKN